MVEARKKTLGALIFASFETLDLFGPLEMFGTLEQYFAISLVADAIEPVRSRHGQMIVPDRSVADPQLYDIILVPGGQGTPIEEPQPAIDHWLRRQTEQAELVLSVCTGSGLLARNGLLDGHRATTNKAAYDWVRKFGPNVHWVAKARWVEDRKFVTSSGVSAGMDMSLAVIARLFGRDQAEEVAKITEYTWSDDASYDPFAADIS